MYEYTFYSTLYIVYYILFIIFATTKIPNTGSIMRQFTILFAILLLLVSCEPSKREKLIIGQWSYSFLKILTSSATISQKKSSDHSKSFSTCMSKKPTHPTPSLLNTTPTIRAHGHSMEANSYRKATIALTSSRKDTPSTQKPNTMSNTM